MLKVWCNIFIVANALGSGRRLNTLKDEWIQLKTIYILNLTHIKKAVFARHYSRMIFNNKMTLSVKAFKYWPSLGP